MSLKESKSQRWFTTTRALCLIVIHASFYPVSCQDDFLWSTVGLSEDDAKYQDIFPLTMSNFSKSVMDSFDPWVVLLHQGTIDADWKTAAIQMRGVVWFGMIDVKEESLLLERHKFETSLKDSEDSYLARVYPFGKKLEKAKKFQDVINPQKALKIAVQSMPKSSMTQLEKSEKLNEFLMDCILTKPARFPTFFITDPQETFPAVFTAVSIRVKRYFNFGIIDSDSASILTDLDLGKLNLQPPALVVLASFMQDRQVRYKAIVFKDRLQMKDEPNRENVAGRIISYPNVLEFLYNINSIHRPDLPGNNMSEDEEVMTMEDVLDEEKRRFQFTPASRSPSLPEIRQAPNHAGVIITTEDKTEL